MLLFALIVSTLHIKCYQADIYLCTIDSYPSFDSGIDSEILHVYKIRRWSMSSNATGTFTSTHMNIVPIRKYSATRWVRGDDITAAPRSYRYLLRYLFQTHVRRYVESDGDTDID